MHLDIRKIMMLPWIPKVICGVLALGLSWQLSTGVYTMLHPISLVPGDHSMPIVNPIKSTQKILRVILQSALFGEYIPNNLNDQQVKQSSLNMEVIGVLFGKSPQESQVIIRSADGEENVYLVGDALPGGVKVKRITPEGVLFEHEGALESLSLPKNELIFHPQDKPLIEEKQP